MCVRDSFFFFFPASGAFQVARLERGGKIGDVCATEVSSVPLCFFFFVVLLTSFRPVDLDVYNCGLFN